MTQVPLGNRVIFVVLAGGGAVLDLFTKWLAFSKVGPPGNSYDLWRGVFSFTTSYNKGALWGFGRDVPYANVGFAILSIVAGAAILYWLFGHGAARDKILCAALGMIMAGTIGNCYDRLVHTQVRDFLYFELINWPIFNIADSMLVCGAGVLMLQAFFCAPHPEDQSVSNVVNQPVTDTSAD